MSQHTKFQIVSLPLAILSRTVGKEPPRLNSTFHVQSHTIHQFDWLISDGVVLRNITWRSAHDTELLSLALHLTLGTMDHAEPFILDTQTQSHALHTRSHALHLASQRFTVCPSTVKLPVWLKTVAKSCHDTTQRQDSKS